MIPGAGQQPITLAPATSPRSSIATWSPRLNALTPTPPGGSELPRKLIEVGSWRLITITFTASFPRFDSRIFLVNAEESVATTSNFCESARVSDALDSSSNKAGDILTSTLRIVILTSRLQGRFPSPDCPSRSVLNRDSSFRELTSYLVSLRKVLHASGLVPLFDQRQ